METSTKPYFVRALHEWCTDNGLTPYIAVQVDHTTEVPREFVRSGEIVLNISSLATNRLQITNDFVQFQARFGGVARDVMVPMSNISAIYAKETGHGMPFEVVKPLALAPETEQPEPTKANAPALTVVSDDFAKTMETSALGLQVVPSKPNAKPTKSGKSSKKALETVASAESGATKTTTNDQPNTNNHDDEPPTPGSPRPAAGKPRLIVVK